MILADTGPLVAVFDPADHSHVTCVNRLNAIREPLVTTVPVLTEAFHLLTPGSPGAHELMALVSEGGLGLWHVDDSGLARMFELMRQYMDLPMDMADASLVTAAELLGLHQVFTLDRNDFNTYRIRRGHRHVAFEVLS